MNIFDKICAVLAFVLGVAFLAVGGLGLFFGSSAHFTLPPVLGGLPLLLGWGIVRPIYLAWSAPSRQRGLEGPGDESARASPFQRGRAVALDETFRVDQDLACGECGYNLRSLQVNNDCPECGLPVLRSIIRHERPGEP